MVSTRKVFYTSPIPSAHQVNAWRCLLIRMRQFSPASCSSHRRLVLIGHSDAPTWLLLFLLTYIGDFSDSFGWLQTWTLHPFSDWLSPWWSFKSWSCLLFSVDAAAKGASVSAISPRTSENLAQVLLLLPSSAVAQHLLRLPCRMGPRWHCHIPDGVSLVIWREEVRYLRLGK